MIVFLKSYGRTCPAD